MDEASIPLLQLLDRTAALVAVYDSFDRLRFANSAFRAAFFLDSDATPLWSEIIRQNFEAGRGTVIRTDDIEAWLTSTQARRGKVGFRAYETDMLDGRWLWMTETVQPDGCMLCIASDITGLRADSRALRRDLDVATKASHTDELTGIANRRSVNARVVEMLERHGRSGINGCLCLLDLDNFKALNDRLGHQQGDLVLRDFAARIVLMLRRGDCFGRVGGEEFALVLPRTIPEQATLIVERMLGAIRVARPLVDRPDVGYTFSAGIAAVESGDTAASLFGRADKALYAAKMSGRNRIHSFGSETALTATAI
jgi:diguanylate cyclase (GGDEF)-like protein